MTDVLARSTDRWVRVGRSALPDAASAGAQAARTALDGDVARLLLVFCSTAYDVTGVLDGVCSVTPDEVVIAGCTTNGELAWSGPGQQPVEAALCDGLADDVASAPSVVVVALGGEGFTVLSRMVPDVSTGRRDAGAAAACVMEHLDAPHRILMVIADGLTGEQHELVRGAYSVLGMEVPIVGGCSADADRYVLTHQFHGTGAGVQAHVDSIIAIAIGSSAPMGIGIAHGWVKQGDPMVVTRSEAGEVFLLDDEPALDVYLRRIGADRTLLEDPTKFREVAFLHPLGMSRRTSEDIRVVHDGDLGHGSLLCLADVPAGALVWTMSTDVDSLIQAASDSCTMALRGLGGAPPSGLIVFDCAVRKHKLGVRYLPAEQAAIAVASAGMPFGGFYTFGEIGRTHGSRGMHHLTVVTLALA
jgi:hypothetical protein